LTGAVFSMDRDAVVLTERVLRNAAGNLYINDKPTGAVVGQQPFGRGRASGTNDKAGSLWNRMRWVSPRAIKECFVPPVGWRYRLRRRADQAGNRREIFRPPAREVRTDPESALRFSGSHSPSEGEFMCRPPETGMLAPVMFSIAATKVTVFPMSSGVCARRSGMNLSIAF
jgi:hypothetical protein